MITISHSLIGGAIGVAVGITTHNVGLAFAAGVASHFICDTIPHLDHPPAPHINGELVWTPLVWRFAITDVLVACMIGLILWVTRFGYPIVTPFVWGAFGAVLPDIIDNVPLWKGFLRRLPGFTQFHVLHEWTHDVWHKFYHEPKGLEWPEWSRIGIVSQVVLVGISVWYLLKH